MKNICEHCNAFKYPAETPSLCCHKGKVQIPLLEDPPEPLKTYLLAQTEDAKHFCKNIRAFNSSFQMTSFGVDRRVIHRGFCPTFTIQGQVHHRIGSIFPPLQQQHSFLQIYFMGSPQEELDRRCKIFQQINRYILYNLQNLLHENNNLIRQFKTAKEQCINDDYRVIIRADRVPSHEYERRFNAPTVNEVAVIMVGNASSPRDIILRFRDNTLTRISECHKFYDALQYPLIYWKGQQGYATKLPQINPSTGYPASNKTVSCMQFYSFLLMIRSGSEKDHALITLKSGPSQN